MVDNNHKAHLDAIGPDSQKFWVFCTFEKRVAPTDQYITINRLYGPFISYNQADMYLTQSMRQGCHGMHRIYTDDEKPLNVWECPILSKTA